MANDWINHVKHYAATHGITYGEAMKKAKASYTKSPRKMKGGQTLRDWGLQQYNTHVPEDYHTGVESLGRAALSQMGFGLKKRKPRKMKGGQTLRDWGLQQYDDIVPEPYRQGVESLGRAAASQMGFGLKKRKPRKIGGDIWGDIGRAFQPVRDVIKPARNIGRQLIQREIDTAKAIATDPRTKALAKQVAHQILQSGVDSAGPAAAAAAAASGNPELAPAAAILGRQLALQAQPYGDKYIDGLGLRKRRVRKGRALAPAGYY